MKDTKTKTKILMGLGILLIIMGVGYAALSATLNINGTAEISGEWNVYISNIEEKELGNAKTISTKLDSKTTASFSVDLEKPGSYAEYEVTVRNDGNLDAILTAINGIDEANAIEPTDIEYSIKNLEVNTPLLVGEEIKFIVRVDFKETATSLPTTTKNLTLSLDFEQSTGGSVEPTVEPTKEPTPESCFTTNGGEITEYLCSETDIVIPDTINGHKITSLKWDAFKGKGLTSVVIPNGVTTITTYTFQSQNLTSVVIPDSVIRIDESAFSNNQLTDVVIPNSVSYIGINAFAGNQLTNVTLSNGLQRIERGAFTRNQLTNITIPKSTYGDIYIGDDVFGDNPNLTKIVNLTGKAYNWGRIIGDTSSTSSKVTGTYGNVTVTAE